MVMFVVQADLADMDARQQVAIAARLGDGGLRRSQCCRKVSDSTAAGQHSSLQRGTALLIMGASMDEDNVPL